MRETAESLPPDLQPAAQTLMSPAEAAADKTSAPSHAEQVMGGVMIPDNPAAASRAARFNPTGAYLYE